MLARTNRPFVVFESGEQINNSLVQDAEGTADSYAELRVFSRGTGLGYDLGPDA